MVSNIWGLVLKIAVIILFVVSLVMILFFANGYSYDFVSQEIRRTGGLDLIYTDKQAVVYLDGKQLDGKLPFVIGNVLPGKYKLVVAREGYTSWQKDLQVEVDLVKKIDDIFIFPDHADQLAKELLAGEMDGGSVWMREGYLFVVKGQSLSYGRLSASLTVDQLEKLDLAVADLQEIKVWQNRAVLLMKSDIRYSLDLVNGKLEKIVVGTNYYPVGDKWLYKDGKYLAMLDQQFTRVLWSGQISNRNIAELDYQLLKNLEFVKVKFEGDQVWYLYLFDGGNLVKAFDQSVVSWPFVVDRDDFLVFTDSKELWEIKKSTLGVFKGIFWKRFSGKVEIMDYLQKLHLFLLKIDGKWVLSNFDFINIVELFPGLNVDDVQVDNQNNFYYLNSEKNDQSVNLIKLKFIEWLK